MYHDFYDILLVPQIISVKPWGGDYMKYESQEAVITEFSHYEPLQQVFSFKETEVTEEHLGCWLPY